MRSVNICCIALLLLATGCGSVVAKDEKQNAALQYLSHWKQASVAVRPDSLTAKQRADYPRLQDRVNEYIKQRKEEADRKAGNIFGGTVDLSEGKLTQETIRLGAEVLGPPPSNTVEDIWDVIKDLVKQSRQASADELKAQLESYRLQPLPPPATTQSTQPAGG